MPIARRQTVRTLAATVGACLGSLVAATPASAHDGHGASGAGPLVQLALVLLGIALVSILVAAACRPGAQRRRAERPSGSSTTHTSAEPLADRHS